MQEFLNRLVNVKAPDRPGRLFYPALVVSACALLPGLMMMLGGDQFLSGLVLVIFSLALAIFALLPAWRSHRNQGSNTDLETGLASGDEFVSLRATLKAANQSRAVDQLNSLNDRRNDLRQILERKFKPGELTFNRYLHSAERVYAIALGNIKSIARSVQTTKSVDTPALRVQLDEFIAAGRETTADALALRELIQLQEQIPDLLESNEQALTSLSRVIESLSEIETSPGKAVENRQTKEAIEDLNELARRSDRYDKR